MAPRNTANLAFFGKLLLLSLDRLKSEFRLKYDYDAWNRMCTTAMPLFNPPTVSPAEPQSAESAVVDRNGWGTAAGQSKDSAGGPP
jgi:hypothetical protein